MVDRIMCSVCLGLLVHPVKLTCKHLFCLQCIDRWVRVKDIVVRRELKVECPLCKDHSPLPAKWIVNRSMKVTVKKVLSQMSERERLIFAQQIACRQTRLQSRLPCNSAQDKQRSIHLLPNTYHQPGLSLVQGGVRVYDDNPDDHDDDYDGAWNTVYLYVRNRHSPGSPSGGVS